MEIINEGNYGEKLYKIGVGTGTAWIVEYGVYAYNEQEACDTLADYLEENESGLCIDYWHLNDLCDSFQSVDEYAEANNLTCCGNHSIYEEWIANCTNKNGFLEEVPKCDWCGEYCAESELKNTDLGKLCDRCIAAILSRGESITIVSEED